MTERTAYKLSEVREALNIGRTTMYRWIKEGKIEVTRLGGRSFVKRESLKGLLDQEPIPVSTPLSSRDAMKRNGNV
jgi:excisionase family DNA binding protein